jgi:L,D-peptidoglycan transpeptidase YkuD (ErfK/YbiS/YcfS/YnhG family)
MNIRLKGKYLYYLNFKIKCAIGKNGTTKNKHEGDLKTPKGIFKLKKVLYRKDRIKFFKSPLKKYFIRKNVGWCDDPNSKYYNREIKLPFKGSAEKLWRKDNIYDLIIVINFNLNPAIKNKGSAIFLHICKRNYTATKGCIAINKKDMMNLLVNIKNSTKLII